MLVSRRSLLAGSVALGVAASVSATDRGRIAAARALARDLMAANPIPGLSMAVQRDTNLVWAESFGKADLELGVAATPAHRFRLGSVSKVITATLAAQLAARGVVSLDAPIATYMPDLPPHHRATTLEQLLTHRGGVRHYAEKDSAPENAGPIDRRRYPGNAEILAVFIDDPLIAAPGERVAYSTFGYTLASVVLESAAKTPFLALVKREIAEPLTLATLGPDDATAIVPHRVRGYDLTNGQAPWTNTVIANVDYKWAGGGLLATPTDVARFGAAHLAPGKLLKPALDILFTVHTERTDRSPPLGLGWRIDEDASGRLRWHHAGGQGGVRASLVVYPKQKLSIALAANTGAPGDVNGPSATLADIFA
jgi:serine beta-lactamase-like protein LACTB